MNKILRFIIIVALCLTACSKKVYDNLKDQESYEIRYSLIPQSKYLINEFYESDYSSNMYSSVNKNSYRFEFETNDLSRIEFFTTDTSFYCLGTITGQGVPFRGNLIPLSNGNNEPSICHSANGRDLIESGSASEALHTNMFNAKGIDTWNAQEKLPNCHMRVGESIKIEDTESVAFKIEELSFREVVTTASFTLDSVINKKCFFKFESQARCNDSLPKYLSDSHGTLVYDIENKHYDKIETYTEEVNAHWDKISTIPTFSASHEVIEISTVAE